jgi:hypothetical protein
MPHAILPNNPLEGNITLKKKFQIKEEQNQ